MMDDETQYLVGISRYSSYFNPPKPRRWRDDADVNVDGFQEYIASILNPLLRSTAKSFCLMAGPGVLGYVDSNMVSVMQGERWNALKTLKEKLDQEIWVRVGREVCAVSVDLCVCVNLWELVSAWREILFDDKQKERLYRVKADCKWIDDIVADHPLWSKTDVPNVGFKEPVIVLTEMAKNGMIVDNIFNFLHLAAVPVNVSNQFQVVISNRVMTLAELFHSPDIIAILSPNLQRCYPFNTQEDFTPFHSSMVAEIGSDGWNSDDEEVVLGSASEDEVNEDAEDEVNEDAEDEVKEDAEDEGAATAVGSDEDEGEDDEGGEFEEGDFGNAMEE